MNTEEDWTAAVADRMIRETALGLERLRKAGVLPVGLTPIASRPGIRTRPGWIAQQTFGPTADRKAGGTVISVRLRYGNATDASAEIIEVTSDFTPEFSSRRPLEYELGRAQNEYAAAARCELTVAEPLDAPVGPFASERDTIVVGGTRRQVMRTTYDDYYAFRFEFNDIHVTVVGRPRAADLLSFDQVADLEPYFRSVDRENLRSQLRQMKEGS